MLVLLTHALWNGAALANMFSDGQGGIRLLAYLPMIILSMLMLAGFFAFSRRVGRSGLNEP